MSKVYQISRSGIRILYKAKHHRGHGIHSPFVFSLINDVIEEKLPYYAFQDIQDYLIKFGNITDRKIKINKLIFRLVNRFSPVKVLEIGATHGISTLYLTASSQKIRCISVGVTNEIKKLHEYWSPKIEYVESLYQKELSTQDFIHLKIGEKEQDLLYLETFLINHIDLKSVVVIDGIRKNKKNREFWKNLISNNKVIVSLDLYYLGILFFDTKYCKQNYKLSF